MSLIFVSGCALFRRGRPFVDSARALREAELFSCALAMSRHASSHALRFPSRSTSDHQGESRVGERGERQGRA